MEHFIKLLNDNAGAIQGVSTLILVVITAYYAFQTKILSQEANKQRADNALPIIVAEGFVAHVHSHSKNAVCVSIVI